MADENESFVTMVRQYDEYCCCIFIGSERMGSQPLACWLALDQEEEHWIYGQHS
jgi:hypothetical protein